MADLVADQLGKSNDMTRAQAAGLSDNKLRERDAYLFTALAEGTRVNMTVARGAADNSQHARAVIEADGNAGKLASPALQEVIQDLQALRSIDCSG
jgi:hypothetical protein